LNIDEKIIQLFWARSDDAINLCSQQYGRYCHTIASHILANREDSDECVNDTWLRVWHSIPPNKPTSLQAYLGRITRNLALDRYRHNNAQLRGAGQMPLALEELVSCIPVHDDPTLVLDQQFTAELINSFLASLPSESRRVFIRRYWYFSTVREIAFDFHMTQSKVKTLLYRTRQQLKAFLEQKGVYIGTNQAH